MPFAIERLHHVARACRVDDGQQRVQGAERVPQRKIAIVGESARRLGAPLARESRIGSGAVAQRSRREVGVVKGRVEDSPPGRRRLADLDPREHIVPCAACLAGSPFEIPARYLGVQVAPRLVDTRKRCADLHPHHCAGLGRKPDISTRRTLRTVLFRGAVALFPAAPHAEVADRAIEACHEVAAEPRRLARSRVQPVYRVEA